MIDQNVTDQSRLYVHAEAFDPQMSQGHFLSWLAVDETLRELSEQWTDAVQAVSPLAHTLFFMLWYSTALLGVEIVETQRPVNEARFRT